MQMGSEVRCRNHSARRNGFCETLLSNCSPPAGFAVVIVRCNATSCLCDPSISLYHARLPHETVLRLPNPTIPFLLASSVHVHVSAGVQHSLFVAERMQ